jgi:hypothetical protein
MTGGLRQFCWVKHLPPARLIRLQRPLAQLSGKVGLASSRASGRLVPHKTRRVRADPCCESGPDGLPARHISPVPRGTPTGPPPRPSVPKAEPPSRWFLGGRAPPQAVRQVRAPLAVIPPRCRCLTVRAKGVAVRVAQRTGGFSAALIIVRGSSKLGGKSQGGRRDRNQPYRESPQRECITLDRTRWGPSHVTNRRSKFGTGRNGKSIRNTRVKVGR